MMIVVLGCAGLAVAAQNRASAHRIVAAADSADMSSHG